MGLTGTPPAVFMREGNAADPRAVRTRQLLLDAFERQLESGQSSPTVSSLVQEAAVSRSSFYNHFTGAENVGVAAFRELLDAFKPMLREDEDQSTPAVVSQVGFEEFFTHLAEHRVLCLAVLTPGTQTPALAELHSTLVTHLTAAIAAVEARPAGLDAKQAAVFLVGAILSLLLDWLEKPTQTATELTLFVDRMLPDWLREEHQIEAPILVTTTPRTKPNQ
ncbi:TetR/AcrR family transcriptional regulator [Arthrobacter sp. AK01]|uniref:TetR/AcrR family transcriptional regulator n=1 Tax=Micrococcaceae TaxID=1268 RepID=UPI001E4F828D|nr:MULTISPECIES: TetR/AcrR family transcriptional regulator [Micrococcaceae]MCD4853419.1 TetR/AcrR family transcriptional regulator [Arthrobacter sp. AK01]MCP1413777.1 AcrR family transcriptional regulator [Paenarthrobacter sp. A20]